MVIPLRGDFDAVRLRVAARRTKDAAQARRLMIHCACGYRVDYLVRLLVEQHGPELDLNGVSVRLRCKRCRQRPDAVSLVDRPDRVTGGFGGGEGATIRLLPFVK